MAGTKRTVLVIAFMWFIIAGILFLLGVSTLLLWQGQASILPPMVNTLFLGRIPEESVPQILFWAAAANLIGATIGINMFYSAFGISGLANELDALRYHVIIGASFAVILLFVLVRLSVIDPWLDGLVREAYVDVQTVVSTQPEAVGTSEPAAFPAETPEAAPDVSTAAGTNGGSVFTQPEECEAEIQPACDDFPFRRAVTIDPILRLIRAALLTAGAAGFGISLLGAWTLNTETNNRRQAPDGWDRLLPIANGVCLSCGAREKCVLCRRTYKLTAQIKSERTDPRTDRQKQVTLLCTLTPDSTQAYQPWVAVTLPSGAELPDPYVLPSGWEEVPPKDAERLRRFSLSDADPSLIVRPKGSDIVGDAFLEISFIVKRRSPFARGSMLAVLVETDDASRKTDAESEPLMAEVMIERKRRYPAVVSTTMTILLTLLLLTAPGSVAAQSDSNQNPFDSPQFRVRYHTRESLFTNPLLEIQVWNTGSTDVPFQLPQNTVIELRHEQDAEQQPSDANADFCTLLVARLVEAPGNAMNIVRLNGAIPIPPGPNPVTIYGYAFCKQLNFNVPADSGVETGPLFPPNSNYYDSAADSSGESAQTGSSATFPIRSVLMDSSDARIYLDIFRRLFDEQTCSAASVYSDPPAPESDEAFARTCVAAAYAQAGREIPISATEEAVNAAPMTTEQLIQSRPVRPDDLTAQLAIFIAETRRPPLQFDAQDDWDLYYTRLNRQVYMRNFPAVYCLLGEEPPAVSLNLMYVPETASMRSSFTPGVEASGGILAYRMIAVRYEDPRNPTILVNTPLMADPVFPEVILSQPGDYAVCAQAFGTDSTYNENDALINRPPVTAARLIEVQNVFATSTPVPPLPLIVGLSEPITVIEIALFPGIAITAPVVFLCSFAALFGLVGMWALFKQIGGRQTTSTRRSRTLLVMIVLILAAILIAIGIVLMSGNFLTA